MEKVLRPERLDVSPNTIAAPRAWRHWLATFENLIESLQRPDENLDKLQVLINFVAPEIYELFSDSNNYHEAIGKLKAAYVKTPNKIFARHTLSSRKQRLKESLDEYLMSTCVQDCNFKLVTASEHRDQFIRNAFISGLLNNQIRQQLLENKELDLQTAFDQARSIDTVLKSAEYYQTHTLASINPYEVQEKSVSLRENEKIENKDISARLAKSYSYCEGFFHPRYRCSPRNATCYKCQKKGHFYSACRANKSSAAIVETPSPTLATTGLLDISEGLRKACMKISLNGKDVLALIDSGSTDNFIHPRVVKMCSLKSTNCCKTIMMATKDLEAQINGFCVKTIIVHKRTYRRIKMHIFPNLCADFILGQNWQALHKSVTFKYGGSKPEVKVCNLMALMYRLLPHLVTYLLI